MASQASDSPRRIKRHDDTESPGEARRPGEAVKPPLYEEQSSVPQHRVLPTAGLGDVLTPKNRQTC